ncbi:MULTISPECIES: PLP-dependent aminotransferase family protein [unclassified Fusibacter]|uniref:MocR-like pyridoxine biosynthesis transcription factor PdxR n=1 Tax=unclassified Fusibacter TaxID=2624464 RepID=UPI001011434B|nr:MULTISPECIES: PLP-dependent aminotransferase family protein [unclassified Fusibacter]MCK8061026.1 PLP-dependent aminotransferase family protein [Fusibacter sp. A2]NPE20520.1 PLP-dependent aminotransferase family protein [Fusibacter sp. A1]RXV63718.1 PLP-dependent aminotransferase family protein [Fusibacter sp. A1]
MSIFFSVELKPEAREHLYVQLYKAIRKLIESGEILANEKLPPIRTYASALNVNNITIINAYKLLEKHELVYKKVGSGTYVRIENNSESIVVDQRYKESQLPNQTNHTIGINLATTTPSDYLFPVENFKSVLNEVLDRDKGGAFGYQDSRGYSALRQALCLHVLKENGIETNEDSIQILSGAQQGLDVVSKALINYGDTVIVEAPTYTGAIATFKSRGARILELPLEADGPNLIKLREYIYQYRPKLLYVMPILQNPTGVVYSKEKREELIAICNKHQLMVLEDDYCSDLAFSSQHVKPLKAIDTDDLVIYIKSFSKAVMPGLRLGFMLTPERLKQQVIMAKQSTDITTSGLTQRAFERFITHGYYETQKNMMHDTFKNRYQVASEAIKKYLAPHCEVMCFEGGFNFWLKLRKFSSSKTLYEQLKIRGVLITSGDAFYASKVESPYFRITIAGVEADELTFGIKMIGKVLDEMNTETTDQFKPIL